MQPIIMVVNLCYWEELLVLVFRWSFLELAAHSLVLLYHDASVVGWEVYGCEF